MPSRRSSAPSQRPADTTARLHLGCRTNLILNDLDYSQRFTRFKRAVWPPGCFGLISVAPVALEHVTISWMPANLVVRTYALHPEPGNNFDLHTTIRWCQDNCMRVSLWGAYRICPEPPWRAVKQAGVLGSDQVRYKANDAGYRSDRVSNCTHALSSIVDGFRLRVASPGWGEMASWAILERFERYIANSNVVHPWVGSALGLDQYPIIYRDFVSPRSGFFGPFYRALGGERDLIATYGPPAR